jgi:hypothetical protein
MSPAEGDPRLLDQLETRKMMECPKELLRQEPKLDEEAACRCCRRTPPEAEVTAGDCRGSYPDGKPTTSEGFLIMRVVPADSFERLSAKARIVRVSCYCPCRATKRVKSKPPKDFFFSLEFLHIAYARLQESTESGPAKTFLLLDHVWFAMRLDDSRIRMEQSSIRQLGLSLPEELKV